MAVSNLPIFPQAINVGIVIILTADTTTIKTLFTAGANGSKVEGITISSSDTVNRTITLWLVRAAANMILTTVLIPLSSGTSATIPAVDVLRSTQLPGLLFDANGNRCLYLKSGDTLGISSSTTVTASTGVYAVALGEDF